MVVCSGAALHLRPLLQQLKRDDQSVFLGLGPLAFPRLFVCQEASKRLRTAIEIGAHSSKRYAPCRLVSPSTRLLESQRSSAEAPPQLALAFRWRRDPRRERKTVCQQLIRCPPFPDLTDSCQQVDPTSSRPSRGRKRRVRQSALEGVGRGSKPLGARLTIGSSRTAQKLDCPPTERKILIELPSSRGHAPNDLRPTRPFQTPGRLARSLSAALLPCLSHLHVHRFGDAHGAVAILLPRRAPPWRSSSDHPSYQRPTWVTTWRRSMTKTTRTPAAAPRTLSASRAHQYWSSALAPLRHALLVTSRGGELVAACETPCHGFAPLRGYLSCLSNRRACLYLGGEADGLTSKSCQR